MIVFKHQENQHMYFFAKYIEPHKYSEKLDKIKRPYNNYKACKNCKVRNKCLTCKQKHKTITKYGSEIQKAMNQKMEKHEYKDEYTKRSSVEGPFGTFKEQFQIDKEVITEMIKTEEKINLDALAYNLIRLHKYKTRNKKYNRRFRRFLRKYLHKKPIKTQCNNILKKINKSVKI